MHPRRRLAHVLLVLAGCLRTTPQPPAPPPPPAAPVFVVPPGCEGPLGGRWVHASDPHFRYAAQDDGGTLTLVVSHAPSIDAGFSPRRFRRDAGTDAGSPPEVARHSVDAGEDGPAPVRVELVRTVNGFVGLTAAPLLHPSGRTCEGHFATAVISCADGGLLLETQSATALGATCQSPASPLAVPRQQHQLVRPDDVPDGGA